MNIQKHIVAALTLALITPAFALAAPVDTASSTAMTTGTHTSMHTKKTHVTTKTHKIKKPKIHKKTHTATSTPEVGTAAPNTKLGIGGVVSHLFGSKHASSTKNHVSSSADVNSDASRATAVCTDGLYSHAASHSGECSGHGGVKSFLQ